MAARVTGKKITTSPVTHANNDGAEKTFGPREKKNTRIKSGLDLDSLVRYPAASFRFCNPTPHWLSPVRVPVRPLPRMRQRTVRRRCMWRVGVWGRRPQPVIPEPPVSQRISRSDGGGGFVRIREGRGRNLGYGPYQGRKEREYISSSCQWMPPLHTRPNSTYLAACGQLDRDRAAGQRRWVRVWPRPVACRRHS